MNIFYTWEQLLTLKKLFEKLKKLKEIIEKIKKLHDFKPTERDSSSKIGIIGDGIISENKDGSYDTMNEIFIDVPGLSSP